GDRAGRGWEPRPARARVGGAGDRGNRRQHGNRREGAEVVHRVEGGVEVFGQHDRRRRRAEGEQRGEEGEPDPIRRRRLARGNGRVQETELRPASAPFHVLGDLGVLIPLHQRVVELLGGTVVPRHLLELLLPLGGGLDATLGGGDRAP